MGPDTFEDRITFARIALFALIALLASGIAISYQIGASSAASAQTRHLISADHLEQVEGYTKVYSDESTDYAIYVKDDYVADSVKVGDTVKLLDMRGKVLSVTAQDFTIQVEDISKVVPGTSGSSVYRDNLKVGFISGWNGDGSIRCIFY